MVDFWDLFGIECGQTLNKIPESRVKKPRSLNNGHFGQTMDDLDLIKQKINIVDFIGEYLPLKKSGVNYKANCPFHGENTPSFVVSPERGIWHCFGCFPPGELVKTPFGYHAIESLNNDHWVVSGKGNYQRIKQTMSRHYNGELVKITPRKLIKPVRLTVDHNVFIIRGPKYTLNKYKVFSRRYRKYLNIKSVNEKKYYELVNKYFPRLSVPAGEIKKGDLLLYPLQSAEKDLSTIDLSFYNIKTTRLGPKPRIIPKVVNVDEKLLKLIGYYIAEGSNHRAYIRFSLGNDEEKLGNEILGLVKDIFGLIGKIHYRKTLLKTGIEVTICHSQLADIFSNLCGKGAENKHIPYVFQELPPSKQRILLDAIHTGDGTTVIANRSINQHKSITSISIILIEQLTDIVLRLNFFPNWHIDKPHRNIWGNHRQAYTIFWSEEVASRYNTIYYLDNGTKYWLLPVKQLEREKYEGPVYNLTVNEDHSYVATSFAVSNCGKGGDVFKFLMEKEGLDFTESLEILAKRAGVTLTRKASQKNDQAERLYLINQKAAEFFHYLLTDHKLGASALKYLNKRGLTDETIKLFNLGYSPNSWETLTKFLLKRGFTEKEIIDSGLAVPSKRACYDRFRGRVIFPLINVKDQVIGFAGRVLDSGEPKYINTPQTLIFDKSHFLFGLSLAKGDIRQEKQVILVEGEMDMIISFQSGIKNIVASKGTALTSGQIELLKKYTDNILLCFDHDLAGDNASRRGIEMADQAGLNIKVISLEGGKDPAEIASKNPEVWQKAIDEAKSIYDYYFDSSLGRHSLKTAQGKKELVSELLPIISKISDVVTQEHYLERLSFLVSVPEELLRRKLKSSPIITSNYQQALQQPQKLDETNIKTRRELLEEYLLALLFKMPTGLTFIPKFPETIFQTENYRTLFVLFVIYLDTVSFKAKAFKIGDFVKTLPDDLVSLVDRLYLVEIDSKFEGVKDWQSEVTFVVEELKKVLIKASLEKLSAAIKIAQSFGKVTELTTLNKRFRDLSVKLKSL